MTKKTKMPQIEDYEPLHAWIKEHALRFTWRMEYPADAALGRPMAVERMSQKTGAACLVLLNGNGEGWDLFTSCEGLSILATLGDAEVRMGLNAGAKR